VVTVCNDECIIETSLAAREPNAPSTIRETVGAFDADTEMKNWTACRGVLYRTRGNVDLMPLWIVRIVRRHREIRELVKPFRRIHVHAVPDRGMLAFGVASPNSADAVSQIEAIERYSFLRKGSGH